MQPISIVTIVYHLLSSCYLLSSVSNGSSYLFNVTLMITKMGGFCHPQFMVLMGKLTMEVVVQVTQLV